MLMSDEPNIAMPQDLAPVPEFSKSDIPDLQPDEDLIDLPPSDDLPPDDSEPPGEEMPVPERPKRVPSFGQAILVILAVTLPVLALMYLGAKLWDLPFPPFDLYQWRPLAGFAPWKALNDVLIGTNAVNTTDLLQRTLQAQWVLGIILFLLLAFVVGLIFYIWVQKRRRPPRIVGGIIAGLALGVPLVYVSITSGDSLQPDLLIAAYLSGMSMLWGVGISYAFGQLMRISALQALPVPMTDGIDRRQFLLQFGAGAAAITAISGSAAAAIAPGKDAAQLQRTLPMISPELLEAERELFGQFRRFAILRSGVAEEPESNVLALGAEYPDRNYVSIWIGGRSPIMIYESLESALAAYSTEDHPAVAHWLDE